MLKMIWSTNRRSLVCRSFEFSSTFNSDAIMKDDESDGFGSDFESTDEELNNKEEEVMVNVGEIKVCFVESL